MNSIKNIEVFRTGDYGDDGHFGINELDQMVAAFKELDYTPALKLGHTDDTPGAPAYGWIKNLRRAGEKLYADFEDMHASVTDAIRRRAYDRCSAEIFFNLKRGAKTFRRALKAVALLGADVPRAPGLIPLHTMQFTDGDARSFPAFDTFSPTSMEVDRRTQEYLTAHPDGSYASAMEAVLKADVELAKQYSGSEQPASAADSPRTAGEEAHRRVAAYRQEHPTLNYSDALQAVLKADESLYQSYGGGSYPADVEHIPSLAESTVSPRAQAGMQIDERVRQVLAQNPALAYDTVLRQVLEQNPALAATYRGTVDLRLG
jgi:hypothetical protein